MTQLFRGGSLVAIVLRMMLVTALVPAAGIVAVDALAGSPLDPQKPESCIEPNRRMTLYATEIEREGGKVRLAWGLTPETASIPGPTIEMFEGECLAITVVNEVSEAALAEIRDDPILGNGKADHPLGVSLHVHGVKYTQASDGTLETDSWVPPESARTYIWYAAPRVATGGRITGQGTAGYWWYHDHIVGTSHGTGGAASGLFGALIVRRPGDVLPDRSYVVGMGPNTTLNLRDFPDCETESPTIEDASPTCFVAVRGELVEIAVIGFGNDFHTFHLHGHTWADNRTGLLAHMLDETRMIDNRTLGPADTFGFVIRAGEEVGSGSWMLHCHVQDHSDSGMSTFLHVVDLDGTLPDGAPGPTGGHDHAAP